MLRKDQGDDNAPIPPCDDCNLGTVPCRAAARARYVITHVDMGPPNPANRDWAIPAMTSFGEATRKEAGNLRYDVLQQRGRTNHFEVVEVWNDQKSSDAHEAIARTLELRTNF